MTAYNPIYYIDRQTLLQKLSSDHCGDVLEELYTQFGKEVYGQVMLITGSEEMAVNITAKVFGEIGEHVRHWGKESFLCWLLKHSRQKAFEYCKKMGSLAQLRTAMDDDGPKAIFEAMYYHGFAPEVIAGGLGISREKVLQLLHTHFNNVSI